MAASTRQAARAWEAAGAWEAARTWQAARGGLGGSRERTRTTDGANDPRKRTGCVAVAGAAPRSVLLPGGHRTPDRRPSTTIRAGLDGGRPRPSTGPTTLRPRATLSCLGPKLVSPDTPWERHDSGDAEPHDTETVAGIDPVCRVGRRRNGRFIISSRAPSAVGKPPILKVVSHGRLWTNAYWVACARVRSGGPRPTYSAASRNGASAGAFVSSDSVPSDSASRSASQRSASSAAMQPMPAAVTACR